MGSVYFDGVRGHRRARHRGALLLEDASAVFVPVIGMVAGIAAMARASHERLKQRMEALETRLAQAEWRDRINRAG
jgi:hypothetical protein